MATQLQMIFNRTIETKKEIKTLKAMYKDALQNSKLYREIEEDLKVLKLRKKKIEDNVAEDFRKEFEKLETLKADLDNDNLLISDHALQKMIKGESIEIIDQYGNKYEPIFTTKFKKR